MVKREVVARAWQLHERESVVLAGRLGVGGAVCSKALPRAAPLVPVVVARVPRPAVEETEVVGAPVQRGLEDSRDAVTKPFLKT